MKYLLLVYLDEKTWWDLSPAEQDRRMRECAPRVEQLRKAGKLLGGAPLRPTTAATTLKYRDGKRLVTDGPFAETREQLGGYNLIEACDLDEAIHIADSFLNRNSLATIEIRPLVELDWLSA